MENLDPRAKLLAHAIALTEGGGQVNYNAKGKAGETGAFQFMPTTWKGYAKDVLGDENADMTPENQNKVAYTKIKNWLDAGKTPAQVASMWNAGEKNQDAWKGKFANGKPSYKEGAYDVPGYVNKVQQYGSKLTGARATGSAVGGFDTQAPAMPAVESTTPQTKSFGESVSGLIGGFTKPWADVAALPMQAAIALANKTGVSKALVGKDLIDPYSEIGMTGFAGPGKLNKISDVGGKLSSAATVASETATAATLGGLWKAFAPSSALHSGAVKSVLSEIVPKGTDIAKLSTEDTVNALADAAKYAPPALKLVLDKALTEASKAHLVANGIGSFAELNPATAKVLGISGKALKYILEIAGLGTAAGAAGYLGSKLSK